MSAEIASEPLATATVALTIWGERFQARITVPAAPTSYSRLLPVFRGLADSLVGVGVDRAEASGEKIACSKGCWACCRQLIGVSPAEARQLRALLDGLPEPVRTRIRNRFETALQRVSEAGLLDRLSSTDTPPPGTLEPFLLEYFHLGIACPFLEDEACTIYDDRPISCREYLVTSDPVHCALPSARTVSCVPIPARVSAALCRIGGRSDDSKRRWVPLLLAPEWAERNPDESPERSGPDLLREFFEELLGESSKLWPTVGEGMGREESGL